MTAILLNQTNFDQAWAAETLYELIRPGMKVCILPLAYEEGWASDAEIFQDRFSEGSEYYEDLRRPFLSYGIKQKDIYFADCHREEPEELEHDIRRSDILCVVGNDPEECMLRMEDLGLIRTIRNYPGLLITISEASKILLEEYYRTPDEDHEFEYRDGLGLLSGFDLDTHYFEDVFHLGGIIRALEEKGRSIAILPDKGGILLDHGNMELLGNAFIAGPDDLDEIYQLYHEVEER